MLNGLENTLSNDSPIFQSVFPFRNLFTFEVLKSLYKYLESSSRKSVDLCGLCYSNDGLSKIVIFKFYKENNETEN